MIWNDLGKAGQFDDLFFLSQPAAKEIVIDVQHDKEDSPLDCDDSTQGNSSEDPIMEFMETVPRIGSLSVSDPPEMLLPGLIIHIVPEKTSGFISPMWMVWKLGMSETYKAYISHRERFKDIVVSPSMFLDHLPWRYYPPYFYSSLSSNLIVQKLMQ